MDSSDERGIISSRRSRRYAKIGLVIFVTSTVLLGFLLTESTTNAVIQQLPVTNSVVELEITRATRLPRMHLPSGTPHAPIYIDGDDNFSDTALAEGWSGDGSLETPYVIDGLDIDRGGGAGHCISINDTRAYFTIKNCYLTGATMNPGSGINLLNASNGVLYNNTCNSNYYGIYFEGEHHSGNNTIINNICNGNTDDGIRVRTSSPFASSITTIANNTCIGNADGIGLRLADYNVVRNNTCSGNYDSGICLSTSDFNTIERNNCSGNDFSGIIAAAWAGYNEVFNNIVNKNSIGIYLAYATEFNVVSNNTCNENTNHGILIAGLPSSHSNALFNNTCCNNGRGIFLGTTFDNNVVNNNFSSNSDEAIYLDESFDNTIANNTCSSNSDDAIYLDDSFDNTIANNTCRYSPTGIDINSESYNNSVYWNLFIDNTQNAVDAGEDNLITNNYWSDYVGVDGNADGIGDTPHPIPGAAGNEDPYPWMSPSFTPLLSSWVTVPADQYIEYGNGFFLDLDTTAPEPLVMWINDTARFSIDSNWVIINTTPIDVGVHGLRVTGRNMYGHHLVAEFDVIVQDTTAPEWVLVPSSSMQVEYTWDFAFTLEATDLSGIAYYWINDQWNFSIGMGGEINQIKDLPLGDFALEVRAYDPYDNYASQAFTLSIVDTHSPNINAQYDFTTTADEEISIQWIPVDDHPWKYEIYRDGVLFDSGAWIVSYQRIDVHHQEETLGVYNFTIVVYDLDGNTATDTVIVTVVAGESTTTTATTTATTTPPPPDIILFIALGVGGAVVVIIIVVLWKRR